jgi:hypothetical protein
MCKIEYFIKIIGNAKTFDFVPPPGKRGSQG